MELEPGMSEIEILRGGVLLALCLILLPIALSLGIALANGSYWILWILISVVITLTRLVYSIFVVCHIFADLFALSAMKTVYTLYRLTVPRALARRSVKRAKLEKAKTYEEYRRLAEEVDREEGMMDWRTDDSDFPQSEVLRRITATLEEALQARDVQKLQFTLVSGLLKRNHLGIDERALHMKALSGTKKCIEAYMDKMVECLVFLCECNELSVEEKAQFLKKARRSLGYTALLLSGGGAIAMYHVGVVRTLIEEGLYKYIKVISGTSGGSIVAGLLAFLDEKELLEKALVREVATDYRYDGRMKREGISWFPPVWDQIQHFLRKGMLIDNREFQRTCDFYYGDVTFQEAYERSHKHISITVSASQLGSKWQGGPQRLLLNHITSPHVLIRSAVAASCSLPGIMMPNHLLCKDDRGTIIPFELDGVQYVDGSLQADLPFRRLSAIFSVSNFVVSQVNFHVVPFLPKPHSPSETSLYWRIFRFLDADIRHRAVSLGELGLLPKFFGQDLSGVFRQRYSGNITIVPKLRVSEMIGLRAFCNPSNDEMTHYIIGGRRMTWATLGHIRHNLRIEMALTDCVAHLRRQSYLSFRSKALDSRQLSLTLNPDISPRRRELSGHYGFEVHARPLTPETVRRGDVASFDYGDEMINQQPQQGGDSGDTQAEQKDEEHASRTGGADALVAEVNDLRHENEKLRALLREVLQSTVHHHDMVDHHDDLHHHDAPEALAALLLPRASSAASLDTRVLSGAKGMTTSHSFT